RAPRGSGDAPEFVAGRNPVVESLRAAVPAAALYVGTRVQHDERISEAIKLAADRGVAVLEAGPAELDRLTGGALHQGLALRVRPYDYAHPDDLLTRGADAGQLPLIVALDGITDPRNLGAGAASPRAHGRPPRARWPGSRWPAPPTWPAPWLPIRTPASSWPAWTRPATHPSATWNWPPPRWSWSSAPRAAACPVSSPGPATSWSAFP